MARKLETIRNEISGVLEKIDALSDAQISKADAQARLDEAFDLLSARYAPSTDRTQAALLEANSTSKDVASAMVDRHADQALAGLVLAAMAEEIKSKLAEKMLEVVEEGPSLQEREKILAKMKAKLVKLEAEEEIARRAMPGAYTLPRATTNPALIIATDAELAQVLA